MPVERIEKFPRMKQKIIEAAKKKILFLPHAIRQTARPDRMISTDEIREAVVQCNIIEEYPKDYGKIDISEFDPDKQIWK